MTAAADLVRAYLSSAVTSGPLKKSVEHLLAVHADMTKIEQQIATARDQMGEYRTRMDEIHAQLVTLKAVRTSGELMATLRAKLAEMSERMQKTTIEIVETQEKLMLSRVKFQNQLAELKLTDATKPPAGKVDLSQK